MKFCRKHFAEKVEISNVGKQIHHKCHFFCKIFSAKLIFFCHYFSSKIVASSDQKVLPENHDFGPKISFGHDCILMVLTKTGIDIDTITTVVTRVQLSIGLIV